MQVTEIMADGSPDVARYSEFMRYLLPPKRVHDVEFDGWGRYKVPSPTTGRPTAYSRATTVAKTIGDDSGLVAWKIREKVKAVLDAAVLHENINSNLTDTEMALAAAYGQLHKMMTSGAKSTDINRQIDLIHDLSGGADSRELGGAVHDWLGELDMGYALLHQLPDYIQPYARSYLDALARAALVAVPKYVERLVLNDRGEETVCGRIDRMYQCVETGELYLGDLKTSKSLDFALLEYGVQFAVYGYATLMLGSDGQTWEPMPEINQDMVMCVHVPSDKPEQSQVVPFDLYSGGEALIKAIDIREARRAIPKRLLGHTTPIPSEDTIRYVEARQALQCMRTVDDAITVKETYKDVWTDDLDEFGAQCFELISK